MNSGLPENEPHLRPDWPLKQPGHGVETPTPSAEAPPGEAGRAQEPRDHISPAFKLAPMEHAQAQDTLYVTERPLFQSWYEPQARPPVRIPNFGHLCLLCLMGLIGLLCAAILFRVAMSFHLYGVSTIQQAMVEIHYTLGLEALLYLFTFVLALLIFPLFWHKSLMSGLQWNGAAALRLRKRLAAAAFICFLIALLNSAVLPGPANTPIEKIFRMPGAPWLLFAFGVTLAPFFEEMFFRGFLLPALCTAYDWLAEKTTGEIRKPLDANGHPQWSLTAMVIGSIVTSLPFAWMHGAQTGYSLGPFFLLVGVSLVLCAIRLWTRSLAASVMVHACYNFLLFTLMLVGTEGFRHLNRM